MEKQSIQKAGMYERKQGMSTEVKAEGWETEVMTVSAQFTALNFSFNWLAANFLLQIPVELQGRLESTTAHSLMHVQSCTQEEREIHIDHCTFNRLHHTITTAQIYAHFPSAVSKHPGIDTADLSHWSQRQLMEPDYNLEGKENKIFLLKQRKVGLGVVGWGYYIKIKCWGKQAADHPEWWSLGGQDLPALIRRLAISV